MRKILVASLAALVCFANAQTPVSGYDFQNTLSPYVDNNPSHVFSLEHRIGASPTQPYGPTVYTNDTVGGINKAVVTFDAPQFFRALHGMNANGGGFYVNLYTIVYDVNVTNPGLGTYTSMFNTTADCGNDGDSFIRWDDDGIGNPIGRIGISGQYAGEITPNAWHRVAITVDCAVDAGATTRLTYFVDGVQVNQVSNASGLDGRWAAYSWDDGDTDADHIDLLGDEDGDNGSGKMSLVVFFDTVLSDTQVAGLGPVGTPIVGSTTETLAPTAERITLGTQNSGGTLASWAADDNNARNICKLFVPNSTSPFIRVDLDYTTAKSNPTAIDFVVKVGTHTPGPQGLTLSLQDKTNSSFAVTSVNNANVVNGASYTGTATAPLSRYVGAAGLVTGHIEVKQTGPSTSLFPCSGFEFGNLKVTG